MYQWKQDGISVNVVLDRRYVRKDGSHPIRIRVIYKRGIKDFNTGKNASEAEWEKIKMSKARMYHGTQQYIKDRFIFVLKIVLDLAGKQEFSFEVLRTLYSNATSPSFNVDKEN